MARLLFDAPWWLPTLLAFLGITLLWNGNRRQEAKVRNAGLALVLATVGVLALGYFVDTDMETAVKRSKQLVRAIEQRDWTTMRAILDPATVVKVSNGYEIYGSRDEIIGGAQAAVDRFGLKNIRLLSTTPEQTDTLITITMTALSEQDIMNYPLTTTWQLEWQQSGKTWSLVRITNLRIGNTTGEAAGNQFPRPK
jgi:hypothetical protein